MGVLSLLMLLVSCVRVRLSFRDLVTLRNRNAHVYNILILVFFVEFDATIVYTRDPLNLLRLGKPNDSKLAEVRPEELLSSCIL